MKVQMLVQLDELGGAPNVGDVVDLDKTKAVQFVNAGYAEAVIDRPEPATAAPTRADIEGELAALGVAFIKGADLCSLAALLDASRVEPRDGDGDGNVLDGTPDERPKRKPR